MEKLVLYRCGWSATQNGEFYTVRHPPVPNLLMYWCTGSGETDDYYVGLVAVPEGVDPMTVVRQEFFNVVDRDMTTVYDLTDPHSDRFPINNEDWSGQRVAYFAATGQVYNKPVAGHWVQHPHGDAWWCTTLTELFDV